MLMAGVVRRAPVESVLSGFVPTRVIMAVRPPDSLTCISVLTTFATCAIIGTLRWRTGGDDDGVPEANYQVCSWCACQKSRPAPSNTCEHLVSHPGENVSIFSSFYYHIHIKSPYSFDLGHHNFVSNI